MFQPSVPKVYPRNTTRLHDFSPFSQAINWEVQVSINKKINKNRAFEIDSLQSVIRGTRIYLWFIGVLNCIQLGGNEWDQITTTYFGKIQGLNVCYKTKTCKQAFRKDNAICHQFNWFETTTKKSTLKNFKIMTFQHLNCDNVVDMCTIFYLLIDQKRIQYM